MGKVIAIKRSWGRCKTLQDVYTLIERGIVLQHRDVRRVSARFTAAERDQIVEHFAVVFCQQVETRAMAERTVESLLVWLTWTGGERAVRVFIAKLCVQHNFRRACWTLTELTLTDEISQLEHGERVLATGVSFICELGRTLHRELEQGTGKITAQDLLWNHLATWLLSLSSINSSAIRLSLLNYFGSMNYTETGRKFFNRIMRRFGYTVLDYLFVMLFNRRSEAMALEYMLHNLPWVLGGDYFTQKILRSVLQHHMYRHPERSLLFLRTFADDLLARPQATDATRQAWQDNMRQSFLHHLAALYLVIAEINQRTLIPEFIDILNRFRHDAAFQPMLQALLDVDGLRPYFRSWLAFSSRDNAKVIAPQLARKRGRRPSFARTKTEISTLEVVAFLGDNEAIRERKVS